MSVGNGTFGNPINWCSYLPKRTTSAKLDEICARAPCVVAVPNETMEHFVMRLLADWRAAGVAGADKVTVVLGGHWAD